MALRAATLSRRMPGRKAPHRALYILEPRGEASRLARGAMADSVKRNGARDGALGCVLGVWASDYTSTVAHKVGSECVKFHPSRLFVIVHQCPIFFSTPRLKIPGIVLENQWKNTKDRFWSEKVREDPHAPKQGSGVNAKK